MCHERLSVALSGICETRQNVFMNEVREFPEKLFFRSARGEVAQYVVNGNTSLADTWLSTPAPRPYRDAFQEIHASGKPCCGRSEGQVGTGTL